MIVIVLYIYRYFKKEIPIASQKGNLKILEKKIQEDIPFSFRYPVRLGWKKMLRIFDYGMEIKDECRVVAQGKGFMMKQGHEERAPSQINFVALDTTASHR